MSFREDAGLPAGPVVSTAANTVPFGFTFDAQGHLVVTETGPNAVTTFTINRDGTLTSIAQIATGGPRPAGSPELTRCSIPPTPAATT